MFVTGHPTTMTFSPLKHLRRFSSHSESPPPKSPADTFNDPLCCQLQLITALQGAEFDDTARHSLAMTIAKMQAAKRTALIQFITQSAIPAAMENNACKAFECATSDLDTILDEHNVTALSDLWHKTHTQIIPTLQAMLYPLQSFDSSFDVRLEILKTFRDRVLTRLLENVQFPIPMLQSMICLVSFATSDTSPEHKRFNDIADRILEKQRRESEERNDMVKLKKIAKARLSVPHSMNTNALRERLFTKKRSITMPSRRFVHFSDELSIDEERPGSFE